jgi:hypothetical protein
MPQYITSKDFNNDGRSDLALINMSGAGLSVFLASPSGTFAPCVNYTLSASPLYIVSDHFNNDNNYDLAISSSGGVMVLFGSATGTFSPATFYSSSNIHFLTTGYFNNDAYKDIATVSGLLLGSSSGSFSAAGNYTVSGGWALAATDFDADGSTDLAINTSTNSILIYTGLGNGTFGAPKQVSSIAYAADMITGDFNGDGKPDLAAGNGLGNAVQVFQNGSFLFSVAASPSVTCNGFTSTLTAFSSVNNYTWNIGGNNNLALVTATANTVYSVSSTNSLGCVATLTVGVIVNTPTIQIVSTANAICAGATATLTAFGANTYTWNTGSNSQSIAVSPLVSTTYTVSGTNASGCAASSSLGISMSPPPVINVTGPSSVCLGNSATYFASGAASYTWSGGGNTASMVSLPNSNTCYSVTGTFPFGCISFATACVTVVPLPTLSISSSTNTVCAGTSAYLTANGASTYSWSTGAVSSTVNVLPAITSVYTLTGTSTAGCTSNSQFTLNVNAGCSDVWPGDANSDGVVNGADVIELGLSFLNTGPQRPGANNSYTAQFCSNWTGTVSSGKNKCHADCNGDGLINLADTLAIHGNFSMTHAFRETMALPSNEITLIPDYPNFLLPGQWNTISIVLANSLTPVTLFGLVFDINYNSSIVEPDSVYLDYTPSFINSDAQNIEFRKTVFLNQKLHAVDVKTNGIEVSGYGKIARFHFKAKPALQENSSYVFGISQSSLYRFDMNTEALTASTLTLTVNSNALSAPEHTSIEKIVLYPNPASSSFVLNNTSNKQTDYSISDITGRVLIKGTFISAITALTDEFPVGIYLVSYSNTNSKGCLKLIIVR